MTRTKIKHSAMPMLLKSIILCLTGLTLACDHEYYSLVSRKSEPPLASSPSLRPFASLDGIPISWDKDDLADTFVLYRQQLPSGGVSEVYRGGATSWFDTGAHTEQLYRYTLAKTRGSRELDPGAPAYGAFDNRHLMDPEYPNDTEAQAREFTTYQISDFAVFYGDGDGNAILDTDWYYCDLPSHTQKIIKLTFSDCDGNATVYDLVAETDITEPLSTGDEFCLSNGTNQTRRLYFCVRANTSALGPSSRRMWSYKLDFVMLSIYNP